MNEITLPLPARAGSGAALVRELNEQIIAGTLSVGAKLPSERALSERFEIARGTVRRVLDQFVASGVLRQEVGSGTFVAALPTPQPAATGGDVSPAELMEARLLFEPLLAGMVVRNARSRDLAEMEHCLAEAEASESFEQFEYWDGRLHSAIGAATHNAFVLEVLELMTRVREAGEWGQLKQFALTTARRRRYERQHRGIVTALRKRDEDAAARLMREHLLEVYKNLFGEAHS